MGGEGFETSPYLSGNLGVSAERIAESITPPEPTPPRVSDASDMALLEELLGRWRRLEPTLRDELLARLRDDQPGLPDH